MSAQDHAAHEHGGPGYAVARRSRANSRLSSSPTLPRLYEGTGIDRPDFIAVVDVDPNSPSYGEIVHRTEMPNVGDELHHFGWNACSSACHSQLRARHAHHPRHALVADPHPRHLRPARAEDDKDVIEGEEIKQQARTERAAHRPLHARRHRHDLDARRCRRQPPGRVHACSTAQVRGRRRWESDKSGHEVQLRLLVSAAAQRAWCRANGPPPTPSRTASSSTTSRRASTASGCTSGTGSERADRPDDRSRRPRG